MDLKELRLKIDSIDENLIRLFEKRMEISEEIAKYKLKHKMPVHDPSREQQKLLELSHKVKKEYKSYITPLYTVLFKLSHIHQEQIISSGKII